MFFYGVVVLRVVVFYGVVIAHRFVPRKIKMDYKDTINLFETPFPMRGDLAKREPAMLDKWIKEDRYSKVRAKCEGRQKFILHDGPPYANGQLHIGHASNKILKDIIIRSKTLSGFDAPFVPGWDCHGLPIELNIEKKFGKNLAPKQFRDKCREYAKQQIELQKADFIRLGILGDWANPYLTMNYATEADIVRALGEIYQNGYMFRGVKPVHWCIECCSALAEAEVEYQDKQSNSIYVKFALDLNSIDRSDDAKISQLFNGQLYSIVKDIDKDNIDKDIVKDNQLLNNNVEYGGDNLADNLSKCNVYALIWTTTPWTLPANQAICLGGEIEYALVELTLGHGQSPSNSIESKLIKPINSSEPASRSGSRPQVHKEYLLIASDLIEQVLPEQVLPEQALPEQIISEQVLLEDVVKPKAYKVLATEKGQALEGLVFNHPFYTSRKVPVILGEHVTTDAGTGLVHTAPAHGLEDYHAALAYNLDLHNPVGDDGRFISTTEIFAGLSVWQANSHVVEVLREKNRLFSEHKLVHSYPHCWRHKTPLIFRTTSQWFIGMDKVGRDNAQTLRQLAKSAVDNTGFFPGWGRARLEAMIKNRPDWCISRQRNWGVPMTFFVHKETKELHPDSYAILQKIADLIAKDGIDAWFDSNLTAQSLGISDSENYQKLPDTLDVWFDSGTTHFSVLKHRPELGRLADLYLEGSDQHRGWFQSSLLTCCAMDGVAPYKQLLTHGFLVDGQGYKMSKSKGNIISIPDGVKKYGADILRLWVASIDYSGDIAFSEEIMKHIADSYRRIRNTLRFLLANLVDFDSKLDMVAIDDLVEIDKYALIRLQEVQQRVVEDLYPNYQFHLIVQDLVNFCSEDLGGFYLDVLKDRLYTVKAAAHARRSAQTVIYHLACALSLMLSPILCFTADEVWEELHHDSSDSTLYHTFYTLPEVDKENKKSILQRWGMISEFRTMILKELENYRSKGEIGSSLQANLVINATKELFDVLASLGGDLKFVYMVSEVKLNLADEISIVVNPSQAVKCERCWHYSDTVGADKEHSTICSRCVTNVRDRGEIRKFA